MSKKRVGLTSAVAAGSMSSHVGSVGSSTRSRAPAASTPADRSSSTAITISLQDWKLLKAVAYVRTQKAGGRASVSAVIGGLIDEARGRLTAEAGPFLL